ncbi:SWIM zinc finger family protein [Amycolatopsis samaneae]|uniref:SWIM zinc finger domain-containing protein n=1 Tax=Amycolatopsis samaneae TaxID=664691 RepID=A0ABW5GIE9_9PSEU
MAAIVLEEESIRRTADPRSFARGKAYFASGQVRKLVIDGATATATVDGTGVYRVRLRLAASGLSGSCSCPYGADGVFCKHCVAASLKWLDAGGKPTAAAQKKPMSDARLKKFLRSQDVAWLAGLLLEIAGADPLVRARLEVAAGADAQDAYDDRALRQRLEQAIDVRDYVDYGQAYSYFQHVHDAIGGVAELAGKGFANDAIDLAEYTLELLEDAGERIDDSDGGLMDAFARVEEIHFDACSAARPDQVPLAERLAERALTSPYAVFHTALPDYAPVLGPNGMARYRELVEAELADNPYTARNLLERLAECEGGADALIELLARTASSAGDVLRLAERLRQEGRDDEALDWLQRGMKQYPPDPRLRSMAASCHLLAGRRAEACELLWKNFASWPSLTNYQELHRAAGGKFAAWRKRAVEKLRARPVSTEWFAPMPHGSAGHSVLVEVLLWEGDVPAAWKAATSGGCRDDLWLRLARERAKTRPGDAIPVLLAAVDQAIRLMGRDHYQRAAQLLVEARELFKRCGQTAEFKAHMTDLRAAHKPKRALREELNRVGLP